MKLLMVEPKIKNPLMNYYFVRLMFYNKNNLPLGSGSVVVGLWKWRLISIEDIINAVQASSKLNEIIVNKGYSTDDIRCEVNHFMKV